MNKMLTKAFVGAQLFFMNLVDDIKSDERGVSPVVATVLIILITVLLAGIFWSSLKDWFNTLWERIMGTADGIQ